MNFTYGNLLLFSKIEVLQPTLRSIPGQYAMDIDLRFTPTNPRAGAIVVDNLQLSVSFGDTKADIGIAHPSSDAGAPSTVSIRQQPYGQSDLGVKFGSILRLRPWNALRFSEPAAKENSISRSLA